jgi:AbrB family looped-hinge helix DNA binding protein
MSRNKKDEKTAGAGKSGAGQLREAARPYGRQLPVSGKSRLSSQGQVTIPKHIREHLGIDAGDEIVFAPSDKGVVLRPKRKGFDHIMGILAEYAGDRPISDDEISDAWAQAAVERYERTLEPKNDGD